MPEANSLRNIPILDLSRSWIRTGVFIEGVPLPIEGETLRVPRRLVGRRPAESTPPCQEGLGLKWPSGPSPPSPLGEGLNGARLTRSSGPEAGYVRRNHRTYSSVARTTSPCSVAVVVYVSRGGALCPSGRPPNASRISRSSSFSSPGTVSGRPFGGRAGPSYRFVPRGL